MCTAGRSPDVCFKEMFSLGASTKLQPAGVAAWANQPTGRSMPLLLLQDSREWVQCISSPTMASS